jgi:hypothetical protein
MRPIVCTERLNEVRSIFAGRARHSKLCCAALLLRSRHLPQQRVEVLAFRTGRWLKKTLHGRQATKKFKIP